MSNEIEVAVSGWVATAPRLTIKPSGMRVLHMRIGSTPRRRDPVTGSWGDGPTQWFSVVAFRDLAANSALSLHKGMPVLVRGRLEARQWEHEGKTYYSNDIVADSIGPDLSRGTALYAKTVRQDGDGIAGQGGYGGGPSAVFDGYDGPDPDVAALGRDPMETVDVTAFELLEDLEADDEAEELAAPA